MSCGYQWASWQVTTIPSTPSSCDSLGSTSTFHPACGYVNQTHEEINGIESPPIAENCGDHVPSITYPVEIPQKSLICRYTADKQVHDIDGQ